ncbi:uncharacterized protein EAE98_001001 [Botrytis deweyae]|uniref:DUF7492 domain-containing protein n=1 Tax=Botrytis deweyae TaxID=2478750 RepID=A0ABQ7J086_9HELO|nr:uncharacterized protein EAE98_001001 [Botrytis deweyae]KAF7938663.1 hypothetical protein EAE98_001001 [Botrytis deweyae]
MKSTISISIAALLLLFQLTAAHTWADELRVIARNGTFTTPKGYPRAYTPRVGAYNPDDNLWKLLNAVPDSTTICNPKQVPGAKPLDSSQQILSAAPGDFVAVRYQENGHVTEPTQADTPEQGKGFGSGIVYVYGTADSKATDKFNAIHKVWNKDGTGGDKRGKLLATQYFDDMACFLAGNTNGNLFVDEPTNKVTIAMARAEAYKFSQTTQMGPNLWCQTDFQIPVEAQANKDYSIYWVWDWPTMDKKTGKTTVSEIYTSCADIAITGTVNKDEVSYIAPQELSNAAQWSQMVNPFVVDPTAAQKPWSMRATTDLFAKPTVFAAAGTTAHVQPTTAASISEQQSSTTQQQSSTTEQVATATSVSAHQGFTTVTIYVTQTSGVANPTGVATDAQAGVGAPSVPTSGFASASTSVSSSVASASPSGFTSASASAPSGVASASGSYAPYPAIQPFMKRSLQIRGRNVN